MIPDDLLELLRCPMTGQPLRRADAAALERLNARLPAGTKPLTAALLRNDGSAAYPVSDEIPLLLVEEAISLS